MSLEYTAVSPSIFLITSSDAANESFGTGFLFAKAANCSYLLSCAHVIRDVGGAECVRVQTFPAQVIACGSAEGVDDIAVIKVDRDLGGEPIRISTKGGSSSYQVCGFQLLTKELRALRPVTCRLEGMMDLDSRSNARKRVRAHLIRMDDGHSLQRGYSGAPLLDLKTNEAIGVVSYRTEEGRAGFAIELSSVQEMWASVVIPPQPSKLQQADSSKEKAPRARAANVAASKRRRTHSARVRILDSLADPVDFRDFQYTPGPGEPPDSWGPAQLNVPVLDQGAEGGSTAFGLATVANHLMSRWSNDHQPMSVSMLRLMGRRYIEWESDGFTGLCARSVVKAWHKHGICEEATWRITNPSEFAAGPAALDAAKRPLKGYCRVDARDLTALKKAVMESGALLATLYVHAGWMNPTDAEILSDDRTMGMHAVAVVGYNERAFLIQNSWGGNWGINGCAWLPYEDWTKTVADVWMVQLAAPRASEMSRPNGPIDTENPHEQRLIRAATLQSHVISVSHQGLLDERGRYGSSPDQLDEESFAPFLRLEEESKDVLLCVMTEFQDDDDFARAANAIRDACLSHQIHPLFIKWNVGFRRTVDNLLTNAFRLRMGLGGSDVAVSERLDSALEPLVRGSGKLQWDALRDAAANSNSWSNGAGTLLAARLAKVLKGGRRLHLLGHSTGCVFLSKFVENFVAGSTGRRKQPLRIASCALLAPATTVQDFKSVYLPRIRKRSVEALSLFMLSEDAERVDGCATIYRKSFLYLVSSALEAVPRIPMFLGGERILGMQKFAFAELDLMIQFRSGRMKAVITPSSQLRCSHHQDFITDPDIISHVLKGCVARVSATSKARMKRAAGPKRSVRR